MSTLIETLSLLNLQENIKTLISYTVENFMQTLDTVEYVDTFRKLKLKHDQEKDRQESTTEIPAT